MAFAIAKPTKPTIENEKLVKVPTTVQIGPSSFKSVFTESKEKIQFKMVGVKIVVMLDNGDEYSWAAYISKGKWGTWKRSECNSAARHRGHDIMDVLGDLIAKQVADAEQVILDAIDIQDQFALANCPNIIEVKMLDDTDGNEVYSTADGFAFLDEVGGSVYKDYDHSDNTGWATPYATYQEALDAFATYRELSNA